MCIKYTMEYYSVIKKHEIMLFAATRMDLEINNQVKSEKDRHMVSPTHGSKMIQTNLSTKQKQTHRHRKQTYGYQRRGGICQEPGLNVYTLLYIKHVTSEDLSYNTGNYTQYQVQTNKGRESDTYTCMYNITESLWCSPETKGHCKSTRLQQGLPRWLPMQKTQEMQVRSPGVGNGNPLQYYQLENSMDRGAWGATIQEAAKNRTQPSMHVLVLQLKQN